ncbi:MAG: glycoside hydrolase family 127 protein [Candidatus Latescibacteria bacterium]|nr:glycoside hydrolase family 127 protein [Candidatus Latescibacterota bacterium]MBT4136380.1 glycoside hydrolase family 127 protein [Candidatus Latescibacterota bacterium]
MKYQLHQTAIADVVWTDGFWGQRFDVCRSAMVPHMWDLLQSDDISHAFANFQIAAGLKEGRHRGPRFNDGDLYKWLQSAASVYAIAPDQDIDLLMDRIIDVIAQAQRPDGYLFTPVIIGQDRNGEDVLPFADPVGFEMYNFGHLMSTACTHYQATGKKSLLAVAIKAAEFLCASFEDPEPHLASHSICPSHYMGLMDLYWTTNDKQYLDLLKKLVSMRDLIEDGTDDNQTRVTLGEQTQCVGHAVRANYLYAGLVDLCSETGDLELFDRITQIWEDVTYNKMYITGACGALYDGASPDGAKNQSTIARVHQSYGRAYQLPNLTAYGETCANIGYALWNWRMLQMTGDGQYADQIERVLFNSGLSSISLDGKQFFYVNTLRRENDIPFELRWSRKRESYISSFCCPPNIVRTIAMTNRWAYALSGDGVSVIMYGGNRCETTLNNGKQVRIEQETDYPWQGCVRLTIDVSEACEFSLRLRIPEWADEYAVRVNGEDVTDGVIDKGFVSLVRDWRSQDVVELDLSLRVQMIEAHPMVEENRNQVVFQRGPVVYCLESTDLPEGISMGCVSVPSDIKLDASFEADVLDGVVVLNGQATVREQGDWSHKLYRERQTKTQSSIPIRLIPYYAWDNRGASEMTVWLPLAQ